jgi:hypothetical protein
MSTATVLPDRLERFMQPEFKLRRGIGKGVNGYADVCVMQAVAWLAGDAEFTDAPDCACLAIRGYCVRINDSWLFDDNHRHLLKPFAPRIVGTKATTAIERARAMLACDYAVRVFAPIRLRALRREEWASRLESLSPITGRKSATLARIATRAIQESAYAAADAVTYAAADAAAYAAAAAAAYAAAAAAAYADLAAAADAAADVAAAAAADVAAAALRHKALECLDGMLAIQ